MRNLFTLLCFGVTSIIAVNAATPVRRDTTSLKNVSAPTVTTRQAYDQPTPIGGPSGVYVPTRLATPLPNSIHVDRDATIHNYSPTDLVKKILLNSNSAADANRIKNVEHSGWNWDASTQKWISQARVPDDNVWGKAGNTSGGGLVSNYSADERSLAFFNNGSNAGFVIDSGLLLGTGPILMAEGPNETNHGLSDGMTNRQATDPILKNKNTMHGIEEFTSGEFNPASLPASGVFYRKHAPNGPWNPNQSFDRDLDALTSDNVCWTTVGSVLEFDFQPAIGQATFDYVFASDEYPEGVYQANDVFGFFVTGPYDEAPGSDIENTSAQYSISDPTLLTEHTRSANDSVYYRYNIARLPDGKPVGIDYVNWGISRSIYSLTMTTNPYSITTPADYFDARTDTMTLAFANSTYRYATGYDPTPGISTEFNNRVAPGATRYYFVPTNPQLFRYNHVGQDMMEYDGYTVKLQAKADKLKPGKWYHLKLAIAQTVQKTSINEYVLDNNHGSGVFLANLDLGKIELALDDPYNNYTFDADGQDADGMPYYYNGGSNYTCGDYTLSIKFDSIAARNRSTVFLSYENISPDKIVNMDIDEKTGDTTYTRIFPEADTLQLSGIEDTIRSFNNIMFLTDYPEFENGQYVKIISTIAGGKTDTLSFPLFNHVSWGPVIYTPITELNNGRLSLKLKGGSDKLMVSVDGGMTYRYARDPISGEELPYSSHELLELSCDTLMPVILREPRSCWKYDTIWIKNKSSYIEIQRYVDIPKVEGMTTVPNAGKHYVEGHDDFSFTASFSGTSPKLMAEGYYSGTILNLDSLAELQPDGSFKYTIKQVVEPWTVYVDEGTANNVIEKQSVWANGNTLYINSESGSASIYTLTGMLYKKVDISGNAAIKLPRGFYIVAINNQQYKVTIK